MRTWFTSVVALVMLWSVSTTADGTNDDEASLLNEIQQNRADINSLQQTLGTVARQLMLQQLFVEERIRSEGNSGIKQVRLNRGGTRPFMESNHIGGSVASIHDHSNNMRTIGMGEYIAVLNGVEFRTRHNDYRLFKPHSTSSKYHRLEPIEFPDVPPEVTSKKTVAEQVVEMREWFKAWETQNPTQRDYRKYFRPVLCYLEGAWINGDTKGDIEEPFPSDRHFVDAKNWFDLQEKIRFTSYSGRKSNLENYAYLPTSIINMTHGTTPVFVQWNYRILCHPLKDDLKLNRLRVVEDFAARAKRRQSMKHQKWTREARFELNPFDRDTWPMYEQFTRHSLLDKLMEQIPGKDNYQGNLVDDAFDLPAMKIDGAKGEKLNAAYYNRMFYVTRRGAMGLSTRMRGFSDVNLFMAMTTQPKVAGMDLTDCPYVNGKQVCQLFRQKWSYAIPLEIIYLTPLTKWNPYDIEYRGWPYTHDAKAVTAGGRNGESKEKALNGTHEKNFYMTPAAFFNGDASGKDPADTAKSTVWVLDKSGTPRSMSASGVRIFLPSIPGVGILRQRYPIMPVHGEGNSIWKEVSAVTDALMQSSKYLKMYRESINSGPIPTPQPLPGRSLIVQEGASKHTHQVDLSEENYRDLVERGLLVKVSSSTNRNHFHDLLLIYHKDHHYFYIERCDGVKRRWPHRCSEGHYARLITKETGDD